MMTFQKEKQSHETRGTWYLIGRRQCVTANMEQWAQTREPSPYHLVAGLGWWQNVELHAFNIKHPNTRNLRALRSIPGFLGSCSTNPHGSQQARKPQSEWSHQA
jgi:hypothetical protein